MRRLHATVVKKIKTKDGITINYEADDRHHNKKGLFLLHGLGGDLTAWDSERIILKEFGYKTIALDLRGHGFSGHPKASEKYDLSYFAKDVAAVIKHEKIEKLALIGHCYGGTVALKVEELYPKIANALILIDTTYKAPLFQKHAFIRKFAASILALAARILPDTKFLDYQDYTRKGYAKDWSIIGILRNMFYISFHRFILIFDNVLLLDASKILRTITVPTLIITGSNDTIFRPEIARQMHRKIKKSIFDVIEGGNHVVILNNPAELTASINEFLKKIRF